MAPTLHCQTHIKCFTIFICCGCAHGWVLITEDSVMVEAILIQDGSHTSLSNTYKVFHNLRMLWMCTWMSPYHGTASSLQTSLCTLPRILGSFRGANNNILLWLWLQTHLNWLPLHYQTHTRCFTTFIWCGCAYGWVLFALLIGLLAKLLENT